MRKIKIKKRAGGYREIYIPDRDERDKMRRHLEVLSSRRLQDCVHGFVRGKGIVSNALPHVGKKVTISIDLKDFFDTCTGEKLAKKLPNDILGDCLVEGAARQGLPTSPALANIAFSDCDRKIETFLSAISPDIVYTRYADDISISHDVDHHCFSRMLIQKISQMISMNGFRINKKKTRVQHEKRGKREICGVLVDSKGVSVSRKYLRKIRAVKHQLSFHHDAKKAMRLRGMQEFASCKISHEREETAQAAFSEAQKIAKAVRLENFPAEMGKKHIDEKKEGGFEITNDPVRLITPSDFRAGWTKASCLRHDGGAFSKGNAFWLLHPGISVAIKTTEEIGKCHGAKRRKVEARCFLYRLRNGKTVYGERYGRGSTFQKLEKWLESHGIEDIKKYRGIDVVGYIDRISPLPFFDNVDTVRCVTEKGERLKVVTR